MCVFFSGGLWIQVPDLTSRGVFTKTPIVSLPYSVSDGHQPNSWGINPTVGASTQQLGHQPNSWGINPTVGGVNKNRL